MRLNLLAAGIFILSPVISLAEPSVLERAQAFLIWLDSHKTELARCQPLKKNASVILCDGTEVQISEIKSMLSLAPKDLIKEIMDKGISLQILCKDSPRNTFKKWCSTTFKRPFFKDVTSLHGQYVPEENTIVLHSDAYVGSMVHEYIHYLQFQNTHAVYGQVYKKTRIGIQRELLKEMDTMIEDIKKLETKGEQAKAKELLPKFMRLTDTMMKFSPWQKLIDERSIFLAYILFEKELGISKDDLGLARKNLGFLCRDASVRSALSKAECALAGP